MDTILITILNANHVICAIDPQKDADGLHPLNQGYLFRGEWTSAGSPLPCTPLGIMKLLDAVYRPEGGEARVPHPCAYRG